MRALLFLVIFGPVFFSLLAKEPIPKDQCSQEKELKNMAVLYKILSLRNWQATQNRNTVILPAEDIASIRFLTEDQIDEDIKSHWQEAPQFVILKIDTSKLDGKWALQTAENGIKYNHLDKGFIPFNAILESKIVYQRQMDSCDMLKLDIVQLGDSVLRKKARELTVKEILSPEIQNLIEAMKATMRAAPGVGLAAPQIGQSIQLVVIEDMDYSHLTPQQATEQGRRPVPFHVIINPRLFIESDSTQVEFFEGCLSVPALVGIVPRATSVRVECLNERGEPTVIHANGWHARILQHEIDHLNGSIFLDKVLLPTLMTVENYSKQWKGKSIKEIQKEFGDGK